MPRCSICDAADQKLIHVGNHDVCPVCLERVSGQIRSQSQGRPKIVKITEGRELAGVCGGFADAINMDRDWFRALTVLLAIFTGIVPFLIAYIVLAWVLPTESGAEVRG